VSQRNVEWTDGFSHWLIHHAAGRAPDSFAERLQEEWLADMAARPSALSRLRFAIGCCWATRVIAYEHQPASVPVTAPVMTARPMSGYAPHDTGFFSQRSSAFFLVVSLHAVLLYGIVTALSHIQRSATPDLFTAEVLDRPRPRDLPRIPAPTFSNAKIDLRIPPLEIPRDPEPASDDQLQHVIADGPPVLSEPSHPRAVTQVQGGPGAGFPDPDDYYPALARYKEEQGVATVKVCVDEKGRLTSDPVTVSGTGSPRLDEGALKLARAGSGHYRPSTDDGRPVSSCYPFRIRFQLKN
jgi:TonB family protein